MKIKIKDSPYDSVIEAVLKQTKDHCSIYIVYLKTSALGEDKVLMYPNEAWYEFGTDWYEGGDIELLGFIRLQDVDVPTVVT